MSAILSNLQPTPLAKVAFTYFRFIIKLRPFRPKVYEIPRFGTTTNSSGKCFDGKTSFYIHCLAAPFEGPHIKIPRRDYRLTSSCIPSQSIQYLLILVKSSSRWRMAAMTVNSRHFRYNKAFHPLLHYFLEACSPQAHNTVWLV